MAWLVCVAWEGEVDALLLVEEGFPEVEPVVEVSAGDELDAGPLVPEPVWTVIVEPPSVMHISVELGPQGNGRPETEGRADEVREVVTDTPIDCEDPVGVIAGKVGSVEVSGT